MTKYEELYPLFNEYDMYAQIIDEVKAPNVYKAITPYGSFVCKRTIMPKERMSFVGGILRQLQERGWMGVVPLVYTKYDEPYVEGANAIYYVTPWQPSLEIDDARYPRWAERTIVRLAELHHLTQNYRFDDPRQVEPLIDALLVRWDRWLRYCRQCIAHIKERSYSSPFDVVFQANYEFILNSATASISLLTDWRERHRTHAHFRLSIVHGLPHPVHTVFNEKGDVRLLNFDRSVFDTPVRDLTVFFRSHFLRMRDDAIPTQLYQKYEEVFPLRPDENELLAAFLQYPERIMRLVESYYTPKRDWNELQAVRKLEKEIDSFMRLSRFGASAFSS